MTEILKKVLNWVLMSSKDASAVSLTIKGFGILIISSVMPLVGLTHLNLGVDQLTEIVNTLALVVQYALMLVGALMALYGAARKAYLNVLGKSAV